MDTFYGTVLKVAEYGLLSLLAMPFLILSLRLTQLFPTGLFRRARIFHWRELVEQRLHVWQAFELVGKFFLLFALFLQIAVISPKASTSEFLIYELDHVQAVRKEEKAARRIADLKIEILRSRTGEIEVQRQLLSLNVSDDDERALRERELDTQISNIESDVNELQQAIEDHKEYLTNPFEFEEAYSGWLTNTEKTRSEAVSEFAALGVLGTFYVLLARILEMRRLNGKLVASYNVFFTSKRRPKQLQTTYKFQRIRGTIRR